MKLRTVAVSAIALLLLVGFGPSLQDPARLPGEPEMVSKDDEGWATVKFPDLGITVELPGWPTEAPIEFDEEDGKTIKSWGAYDFASRNVGGDIYVYEAKEGTEFSAEEMLDQEIESYEDERQFGNVKTEKGEITADREKVLTLSVNYLSGIDPAGARGYFWKKGNKVGVIRLTWWSEEDAAAKQVSEHIEKSLRID